MIYKNLYINKAESLGNDGITVFGDGNPNTIDHCIIDFRDLPLDQQDEAISGVNGAVCFMSNTIIMGAKKALLCGNGDHYEKDKKQGYWKISNCVFLNCGRRCPEVQDGVRVEMENCWVHNWGKPLDVRGFGGYVHNEGSLTLRNCIYTQGNTYSLKERLIDLGNHIGNSFNREGFKALFKPSTYRCGLRRGIDWEYATKGVLDIDKCFRYPDIFASGVFKAVSLGKEPENELTLGETWSLLKEISDNIGTLKIPNWEYSSISTYAYVELLKLFKGEH